MVWPFVLVLDLEAITVRCRACRWRSRPAASVIEARAAYARHGCTGRPVRHRASSADRRGRPGAGS